MTIANKLQRLLRAYNKTVFAAEAGVSPQTLRNAMNGSTPELDTIRAIAPRSASIGHGLRMTKKAGRRRGFRRSGI